MAIAAVEAHHWSRDEYQRLASSGLLPPGQKMELIDGIIYDMAAQNSLHATGYRLVEEALRETFPKGSGFEVRGQLPLDLSDDSVPEPDAAVVQGSIRDFRDQHPRTAVLVVEVADSSLLHDHKRKIPLYARSGIQEYWILNLVRRTLEVYRDPHGEAYRSRTILRTGDVVSPLARPDAVLAVRNLLP
ncbi:MAG TPA: Uma2 family endonuclease [Thermoanaerobaculia bacterium]|jgi:Uma2 family endonuclease